MIERILDRWFKKKVIVNCDHDPYLFRWYIVRKKSFAIFIHKFIRSDEDRALHDHPWNFLVIPIWRGYVEHREQPRVSGEVYSSKGRVYPIIGIRFRSARFRHRVELLNCDYAGDDLGVEGDCPKCDGRGVMPSWSVFIRFKEFRKWGFWEQGVRFIRWDHWWREKCE